jgi:uncharacterized membrane protein (DUF4010 family)
MPWIETPEARIALALIIGLLLGVERERRKRERGHDAVAGLRTFGLAGLLGGLARYSESPYAVAAGALIVGTLVIVGYALDAQRERDAGITTEIALVLTYLLGALAISEPFVAGTSAIVTALLLHFRKALHHFVRDVLREDEVHDGLLFLVFAFIVLPLAPDVHVGPYRAIHPQSIARLVLLITLVSSAGYIAQRALGARLGLVASGFASGFISSSATIGALGLRAKRDVALAAPAAAGAVASSIATVLQYAAIIVAIEPVLLVGLAWPLGLAATAAVAATYVLARAYGAQASGAPDAPRGRPFQVLPALFVGAASALVAVLSAALSSAIGDAGIVVVSGASGLVDAHATAGSVSSLHQAKSIDATTARLAIVAALSSNTGTKIAMAFASGPRPYALRVTAGVLAIACAAWLGLALGQAPS